MRSLEIATKTGVFRRSYMLALEDNQAVVGAFAKGRSTNYNFNSVCRRKLALELTADIHLLVPWISTKRMPMDRLSRDRIIRTT